MTHRLFPLALMLFMAFAVLSCSKDDSPTDTQQQNVAQYAGTWTGTTGQSLPVYFHITSAGIVDSLTVRIRMSLGLGTCTGTFSKDTTVTLEGNTFGGRVYLPGASFKTKVRATLGSASSASGTYDGYYGSFVLICGSSLSMGTGTMISQDTWSATKSGQ